MRIDKYLKVSHIIKRREVAKEMLDKGFITIDGKQAKPASEVKLESVINITNPNGKSLTIKVKAIREFCPLREVQSMYEIVS